MNTRISYSQVLFLLEEIWVTIFESNFYYHSHSQDDEGHMKNCKDATSAILSLILAYDLAYLDEKQFLVITVKRQHVHVIPKNVPVN
jgi:hypothetical protein